MDPGFRVSGSNIIHENVDGEVIIVDLSTGSYYSLTGTGSEIWEGLIKGDTVPTIVGNLESRYATPRASISDAVAGLVRDLERERLVTAVAWAEPSNGTPGGADATRVGPADAQSGGRVDRFVPPKLESFDDMKDLMLLDPIHEASTEQGWPHRSTQGSRGI